MTKHLALLLSLLLTACADPQGAVCQMVRVTDLPIALSHGHLLLNATLNGAPARLMFDTGSQTSIISKAAARRLHLTTISSRAADVEGIGGRRWASIVIADHFTLGTLHGDDFPFLATEGLGEGEDAPDGILSTDFLSLYDIDLDLPEKKVVLYRALDGCGHLAVAALDAPVYATKLIVPPGEVVRDFPRGGPVIAMPEVTATIDGQPLRAAIDTGTFRTLIFRNVAHHHGLDIDVLATADSLKIGGIGPRSVRLVEHRIAQIGVGDLTIANLPVGIADQREVGDTGMLLGLDFMSRVHLWISNSSGTLIMQFPPRPSMPVQTAAAP